MQFIVNGFGGFDAKGVRRAFDNAEQFATFANYILDSSLFYDDKQEQMIYRQSGASMAEVYEQTLKCSKVADTPISDDDQKRIDRFRGLLMEEYTEKNIITDKEEIRTRDGKVKLLYTEYQAKYQQECTKYNSLSNARAVQEFALNGKVLQNNVKVAYDAWVSNRFKNDYEEMVAFIKQITTRNLTSYKEGLSSTFRNSRMGNPTTGVDFNFTSLYPSAFITDVNSWSKFSFTTEDFKCDTSTSSYSTSVMAEAQWGLWLEGGSASHSRKAEKVNID
ncbi:MAG: hypothetical protein ACI9CD_001057 [Candidatus Deianiraeaceae bacterium]